MRVDHQTLKDRARPDAEPVQGGVFRTENDRSRKRPERRSILRHHPDGVSMM
jgi:hypothetical protein